MRGRPEILAAIEALGKVRVRLIHQAQRHHRVVADPDAAHDVLALISKYEGLGAAREDAQHEAPPGAIEQLVALLRGL
jgi:hypothetical protein